MKGTFGYFNLFLSNNAKLTLTLTYFGESLKNLVVSSATPNANFLWLNSKHDQTSTTPLRLNVMPYFNTQPLWGG